MPLARRQLRFIAKPCVMNGRRFRVVSSKRFIENRTRACSREDAGSNWLRERVTAVIHIPYRSWQSQGLIIEVAFHQAVENIISDSVVGPVFS